jgi:hypothetical protein
VLTLILLAPLFLIFEVAQLVLSERYVGIKQMARGADPRTLGLSETLAFFWTATIAGYALWTLTLLVTPLGRVHGLGLIAVTLVGYTVRRGCPLKRLLVILTFEGALRVGVLISLCATAWHRV